MPGPSLPPGAATPGESLRAEAIIESDRLLECAAALRGELRAFEATIRRARGYFERGGTAVGFNDSVDIATARETLTKAAVEFETARHKSRLAVWQVQAAEGMSVGSIARAWGLSRQLVSRTLKEARTAPEREGVRRPDPALPTSIVGRDRAPRPVRGRS